MKFFSCLLVPLLFLSTAQAQQASPEPIDSIISRKMRENGLVGLCAAILVDQKPAWSKGYGYADREKKIPFTPGTIMNIASISKTITGACMMKAVEEKKLDLDEDINHYLPFTVVNPFAPGEKITLRNLATHTSSLADRYPFYDSTYWYGSDPKESLGDFLKNYFVPGGSHYSVENFLKYKPGAYREYSNIGAGLAGYIVELATGQKLYQYTKTHLFHPLDMKNSGWLLSEVNLNNHAQLYEKKDGVINKIQLYGSTTYPDGGVRTSVEELSHFFACLLNDGVYNNKAVLKKETVAEMLRFQFTDASKPQNVDPAKLNSGIFWATKSGGTRIGHNGSDPGVRTFMLADRSKKVAVVFFANTSLSEKEENVFFDLYNELYKYGQTLLH